MHASVVHPSELELAIGQAGQAVGVTRIEPDGFAELASRRLVPVQHQQVEAVLLPRGGLGRTKSCGVTEERLGDVRGVQFGREPPDAQPGVRIAIRWTQAADGVDRAGGIPSGLQREREVEASLGQGIPASKPIGLGLAQML